MAPNAGISSGGAEALNAPFFALPSSTNPRLLQVLSLSQGEDGAAILEAMDIPYQSVRNYVSCSCSVPAASPATAVFVAYA